MNEINESEVKLLKIGKEFMNFLNSNPTIRFNLHRVLRQINEGFLYIQTKLSKSE